MAVRGGLACAVSHSKISVTEAVFPVGEFLDEVG
jgi:hypothetical protein